MNKNHNNNLDNVTGIKNSENLVSDNINNSSVILTEYQYNKMVEGIEELKLLNGVNIDNKLSPEAIDRMRKRADEIGLNIDRNEISSSYEEIKEVLSKNLDTPRNFTSLLPPYLNKLLNDKEDKLSVEEQFSVSEAVEAFSKALKKCEKEGISEDCLKLVSMSDILNRLIALEKSSLSKNELSEIAENHIKNI